jgi:hypothetical protein
VAGFCEHGDEPSDAIKDGEFLEYVRIAFQDGRAQCRFVVAISYVNYPIINNVMLSFR